jgi:hypothetical protein
MRKLPILAAALSLGLAMAGPALAHHSFAMFDTSKQVMVEGTVETWAFNNPHAWLFITVANEAGETERWGFEGSAPVSQIGRGITGETFKPGDVVRVVMCPLRDGRNGGHLAFVKLADGSVVTPNDAGCPAGPNVAKWQDEGWLDNAANFEAHLIEGAKTPSALESSPTGEVAETPAQ